MKIIAGKYKNHTIISSKKLDYKPSQTKLREAIFSMLSSGEFFESQPIIDANVLDLFAGTGALGLEAISRGANEALFIDNTQKHLDMIDQFIQKINEQDRIMTLNTDARNLPTAKKQYNLVFLDPPYYSDYINQSINQLISKNWITKNAILVIESSVKDVLDLDFTKFKLMKEKIYGNTKLTIIKYL